MTRRAPQRSTSQPIAGQDSAARAACIVSAEENIARPTPSSAVIGFRNTPNAKTLIAPPPTIKPQTVANTIHQRFAKMPRISGPPLTVIPPATRLVVDSSHAAGERKAPLPHRGEGGPSPSGLGRVRASAI